MDRRLFLGLAGMALLSTAVDALPNFGDELKSPYTNTLPLREFPGEVKIVNTHDGVEPDAELQSYLGGWNITDDAAAILRDGGFAV